MCLLSWVGGGISGGWVLGGFGDWGIGGLGSGGGQEEEGGDMK